MKRFISSALIAAIMLLASFAAPLSARPPLDGPPLTLQTEKYTLDNGLDVIFHIDRSDPIVAINLSVHVGSSRENPDRTGFAHLFEHLMFQNSENLGYLGLEKLNLRIGGEGTNGWTNQDVTQYYQVAPNDALEKIIWAESEKLGYFINTVSQSQIDVEKRVVKNEKRQTEDNFPYGHLDYVIGKALYPADHPYNWQVIGALDHLDAATVDDARAFFKAWYVPNNTTLTLAGDFDAQQAKIFIEKYFGEIPQGHAIPQRKPRWARIDESVSLFHEDDFATAAVLTYAWPAPDQHHPDKFALKLLADFWSSGDASPFDQVMIDELDLSNDTDASYYDHELAGEFYLEITANDGTDLDALPAAIDAAFAKFEADGITQAQLERLKVAAEVDFYDDIESVADKASLIGEANSLSGDPQSIIHKLTAMKAVTLADIRRVYAAYIKNKSFVAASFIPRGEPHLALENAVRATVVEEKIALSEPEKVIDYEPTKEIFARTAASFDRSVEPPFGPSPDPPTFDSWTAKYPNGLKIRGIFSDESPVVSFSIRIEAGHNRGTADKPALAMLTAEMLGEGTVKMDSEEFDAALEDLGSSLNIQTDDEYVLINGTSLARHFSATFALIQDMILTPRWDPDEFDTLQTVLSNRSKRRAGNPNFVAYREARKLQYPEDHILHYTAFGPPEKLAAVNLNDSQNFYAAHYVPAATQIHLVGSIEQDKALAAIARLTSGWAGEPASQPDLPQPAGVKKAKIYFYDIPDAKQSVLRIFRPAMPATHPDYAVADVINYLLGGNFVSQLSTELRIKRGYTYGIASFFEGDRDRGMFGINTNVRSAVTLEALQVIYEILSRYVSDFTQRDLDRAKSAYLRSRLLSYETPGAKLSALRDMSAYNYPPNYEAERARRIEALTLAEFKRIGATYLKPDQMTYLVVGDAKTQLPRLNALGFGEVKLQNQPAP